MEQRKKKQTTTDEIQTSLAIGGNETTNGRSTNLTKKVDDSSILVSKRQSYKEALYNTIEIRKSIVEVLKQTQQIKIKKNPNAETPNISFSEQLHHYWREALNV